MEKTLCYEEMNSKEGLQKFFNFFIMQEPLITTDYKIHIICMTSKDLIVAISYSRSKSIAPKANYN